MTITNITEIANKNLPKFTPIKENQDIYIPGIDANNISKRNGMVYVLTGSGGSGKTNLLLNLFRNKQCYKNKFHNIHYFCPESSFLSVLNHPFKAHDKIYHELTVDTLMDIYEQLNDLKNGKNDDSDDDEVQYNCIVIDDFANDLKNKEIIKVLNMFIIKARHLRCAFIFTLQSYYYFPKIIRKQITFISIFKPKNTGEWQSIAHELLNLNKSDGLRLYNYVFDADYTHLDLDTVQNLAFKNFNLLKIKE
jgi:hypothetical protein